jgi:hypothetical protein
MWKILLIAAILLTGCVHTKVSRTGRSTRSIKVSSILATSEASLLINLLYKAQQRRCDEIRIIEIVEGSHAEGECLGYDYK